MRSILPAASSIYLGKRVDDGTDVTLPIWSTLENVALEGKTGAGKTTIAQELDFVAPFDDMSLIALDFIGTGFHAARTHKAFLGTILFNLERRFPELLTGASAWFLRRFAFATLSTRGNNTVRIDILKRRTRPDGSLEPVQEVVDRMLNVFSVRFEDDMDLRVRFRRVARVVLSLLSAAGRSIVEWPRLLDANNDQYLAFVRRGIEERGLAADVWVRRQMEKLIDLRSLPRTVYEARTESFGNGMDDYEEGTPLGDFFGSDETYDPAQAIYGNGRLFVTTDLANETLRREAFLALHAVNTAMFAHRRPGTGTFNTLHYLLDEADKWVPRSILTHTAEGRNLGISTWLLFQNIAQWRAAGIPEMVDILASICSLRAIWRPTTLEQAKELYVQSHRVDPMGAIHRLLTHSTSSSTTETESVTDNWQDAINAAASWSGGDTYSSGSNIADIDGEPRRGSNESRSRQNGFGGSDGWSSSKGSSDTRSTARMVGEAIAETIIRIPFDEQAAMGGQRLLQRPDYQATWMRSGETVEVDMAPPRKFPEYLHRVPILDFYAQWHDGYWLAQAPPRARFEPMIQLVSPSAKRAEERPPEPSPAAAPLRTTRAATVEKLDPAQVVLNIVRRIRIPSVADVMTLTGWSYDKAHRVLDDQLKVGLVDRIQPFAPRGQGSAPAAYILTTAGARSLARDPRGEAQLLRIAKNAATLRRAVEENRPVHWQHRRWTASLLAIMTAALERIDAEARIDDITVDRELALPIDLAPFAASINAKDRAAISPDPTKEQLTYVPDAAFSVTWGKHAGTRPQEQMYLEVQTGFGERDEAQLAIGKAWKLRALCARARDLPRVIVWTPTAALEQRFFDGARSVFGDAKSPLWITNGELLPLGIPPGTNKKDMPAAVEVLVANVQARVWRWLRFPDPADRRRFIGMGAHS